VGQTKLAFAASKKRLFNNAAVAVAFVFGGFKSETPARHSSGIFGGKFTKWINLVWFLTLYSQA
jgi:hypothetical protein